MKEKFTDKYDLVLFSTTIIMVAIGIVAIFSATFGNTGGTDFYLKQMVFGIIGLVIMVVISLLPPKYFSKFSYASYGFAIFLLILVLVFGKTINGNKSWFYIGGFGIQPSEFAKIATVMALANFLNPGDSEKNPNKMLDFIKACIFVLIPFALVKLQNDTGTSLVFLSFLLPIFFWAGLSPFVLFVIITPIALAILSFLGQIYFYAGLVVVLISLYFFKKGILLSSFVFIINLIAGFSVHFLYSKLQVYQQNRIMALFDPTLDPLGSGYNVIQSKVAIGSGGIFGKGLLQGTQTQLRFIPEQWTDFIFCMIGEEFGLIGASVIILLYLIIIIRLINNASTSRNKFLSLVCIGFASLFLFHLFINVGMTIGIMPVIGIPLPLVSYGVSSLLTFMAMIGIGMNTYRHRNLYL
ncbi:MAG: rod shape-determining protein RodA [Ignavibacteriae bacterium]|nr:rod shape-determining protein RodA [Ignavibacteriota bacterium]